MWRRSVFEEMKRMQQAMDAMFDKLTDRTFWGEFDKPLLTAPNSKVPAKSNYKIPASNVWEDEKAIHVHLEIPGVEKENIKLHIDERGIDVSAKTSYEIKRNTKNKKSYESKKYEFKRYFSLPTSADTSNAQADYNNGLLKINIPKRKEKTKRRRLDVK